MRHLKKGIGLKIVPIGLFLTMIAFAPPKSHARSLSVPLSVTVIDPKEQKKRARKMRQEWSPKCRKVWSKRRNLHKVFNDSRFSDSTLLEMSGYFLQGIYGCKESPTLALEIRERLVGVSPLTFESPSRLRELIWAHNVAQRPDSKERMFELRRILWLRGQWYKGSRELFATEEEKRNFIARDDIWAYLVSKNNGVKKRGHYKANQQYSEALFDPLSARFNPAEGIEFASKATSSGYKLQAARYLMDGKFVPKDLEAAEIFLWDAARNNEGARLLISPVIIPRLQGSDLEVRDDTAKRIWKISKGRSPAAVALRQALVPYYAERLRDESKLISDDARRKLVDLFQMQTPSAMVSLKPLLKRKLHSKNDDDKFWAWSTLARLAQSSSADMKELLDADVKRTGGLVDAVPRKIPKNVAGRIASAYPTRALREERDGVVSVELVVSPSGRAIEASVIKSSGFADLDNAAIRSLLRYWRVKFPEYPGRYIRVRSQEIQFYFLSCDKNVVATPALEGAIIVKGQCRRREIQY